MKRSMNYLTTFLLILFFSSVQSQIVEQLSFDKDYNYRQIDDQVLSINGNLYVAFKDLSIGITIIEVSDGNSKVFYRSHPLCNDDSFDWTFHENGLVICNAC